jgi:hypothetical protein
MSSRLRFARLLRQSRIRLPRAPLGPEELRPGDWVQLGTRTWRVRARRCERGVVVFRLRSVDGKERALLETSRETSPTWMMTHRRETIRFPPELLVVFPGGVP